MMVHVLPVAGCGLRHQLQFLVTMKKRKLLLILLEPFGVVMVLKHFKSF